MSPSWFARRKPLVVIIDDLRSAVRSWLLLELVARQLRELTLLVLATHRDAGDAA